MADPLGTVQTLVVCVAGSGNQGPCPDGYTQSVTQAYVVASSNGALFDAAASPFDPVQAGEFWGFAFASTVWLYLTALGCGVLYRRVKGL